MHYIYPDNEKMTSTMKSLACFVTGIALIALVVPSAHIQYVMAHSPGGTTLAQHFCAKIQTPEGIQGSLDCNRANASGHCESHRRYYVPDVGTWVSNSAESISCYEWMEPWYVDYPIKYNGGYYRASQFGLSILGSFFCTASGIGLGVLIGVTPAGVTVGIIYGVTCGLGVTYIVDNLDPCAYGSCSMNWSAGPTFGSDVKRCF